MEIALILISSLSLVLIIVTIVLLLKGRRTDGYHVQSPSSDNTAQNMKLIQDSIRTEFDSLQKQIKENNESSSKINELSFKGFQDNVNNRLDSIKNELGTNLKSSQENLNLLKNNVDEKLKEIKGTVDEKLQKTLEEKLNLSFQQMNKRLEAVSEAMGKMETLSSDVSSLSRTLSNVKQKGIIGETFLGNILEDILTKEQYVENVEVRKNSRERVEFAVKLPGKEDGKNVLLPIDSKFPTDSYNKIHDCFERNDKEGLKVAKKELESKIRDFAKEISSKYINPPVTTDFAVMFLPTESLYLQVLDLNILNSIRNEYKVMIAGPSTITAFLNALSSGFKTLAIEKKSKEIIELFGKFEKDFDNYCKAIDEALNSLDTSRKKLEALRDTRTNVIRRDLNKISTFVDKNAPEIENSTDIPVE